MDPASILVVDDDPEILNGTARLLEKAGYVVARASDGDEALQVVREQRPDLLLLDRDLPVIDGVEVCRRVKQDPALADTCVLIVSGSYTDTDDQAEGLESGADGYITRPIANRELLARVGASARIRQLTLAARAQARELQERNEVLRQQRLASLKLMEDAIEARNRLELAHQAAHASEEKYRLLVETTQEAIFVVQDGILRFVNKACSTLTGRAAGELLGKAVLDLAPAAEWDRLRAHHERVLYGGQPVPAEEFTIVLPTAAERLLLVNAVPIEWEGRPATLNIAVDITERQQRESVLSFLAHYGSGAAGDEGFFAALARFLAVNLGMDFVCIDRLEGDGLTARTVAVWCNGKFEDNVTYALKDTPCGEVVGKTVCCFPASVCQFFPRDTVLVELRAESYVGVTLWSHTGRPIGLIAVIGRRPLANRPLAEAILTQVAVRAAGELERTLAEEDLARQHRLLRTVIDHLPDFIYAKDREGRFVIANAALTRDLGLRTPEELVGKTDFDCHPQALAARYRADELKVIESGQALLETEEPVVDAAGQRRWFATTKVPLRDDAGIPVGLVGVGRNITARKRAEAERERLQSQLTQAQKMELVGRLAGGVAHDFNNLLMGIMNYVDLCRDGLPPDHAVRGYLDEITSDAKRSVGIARQLLAFARKQTIAPQVLDLNDALEGMLKMLRHLIGEDIELAWLPGAALWPVKVDPGQIDQILANLCVNARDAIAGVGKVTIATANARLDAAPGAGDVGGAPGDYVRLAVSDSGCGMDKEVLAHLFEPFFTTKGVGQGTGLGLATVYGISEQNDGRIEVDSAPGQGTTFRIYLPRFLGPLVAPAAAEAVAAPPGGTETILLVEDEKAVRLTTQWFLTKLGYTVLVADRPDVALSLAGAHSSPIHLLVTDVVMPGMNGHDLAARLVEQRPGIACLFMSGYTADVIAHRGVLEEGTHFLSKPFSRGDLARKVRELLDR
jgi:PAS domain S-box-containing protein